MTIGTVEFKSSNSFLEERFKWAKEMALSYAHYGEDPVGKWYEAALPERASFCIRDISHQIHGATFLGLNAHSKNMLTKFVENISSERDYCTYWEINQDNQPTAVDYTNDQDFWYVLLANFELVVASYQQYRYTGDLDFLESSAFKLFFSQTFNEYTNRWDLDDDGILEHYAKYGRRGLASYNEVDTSVLQGGDMLAVQYAAYQAYSQILTVRGEKEEALLYQKKAKEMQNHYLTEWQIPDNQGFYGAKTEAGTFYQEYYEEGSFLPIYFQIFQEDQKLEQAIKQLVANPVKNVEGLTYMAQTFYQYDKVAEGWSFFQEMLAPDLPRNDYPEVSYSVIANFISGLMGLKVTDYLAFSLRNNSQGNEENQLRGLPLFNGYLDVSYPSKMTAKIAYQGPAAPTCTVVFTGSFKQCLVNGQVADLHSTVDRNGQVCSVISVTLINQADYLIEVIK